MKQELKRCPCCGGYTKYEYKDERERDGIRKYVRAACQNCGISTLYHPLCDLLTAFPDKYSPMFPQDYEPYDGEEIVAKEWNRRVEQEVIDEKNDVTEYISEGEHQNIDETVLALNLEEIRSMICKVKGWNSPICEALSRLSYCYDDEYNNKYETVGDLICVSPKELAADIGSIGEQGYNEIVNLLEMYGIDTNRYRAYHYNVDPLSFNILFDCDFSTRTIHAIYTTNKIRTVGELVRLSPKELIKLKGVGEKAYNEVVDNLKALGIDTRKYTK